MTTAEKKTREQEMAERFARDTAHHELTIAHDDGVYRHIKARSTKAGEGWCCWFEVVTWPGRLVITGDCGTYVFARLDDMFEFFRIGFDGRINPGYWAEKTPGGEGACKVYSEDVLRERLADWLADYEADYPAADADYEDRLAVWQKNARADLVPMPTPPERPTPAKIRRTIDSYDDYNGLSYNEDARGLLSELEDLGALSDAWEWNLTDWDWQFLWCCHAIVWAIAKYDAAKTGAPTLSTAGA